MARNTAEETAEIELTRVGFREVVFCGRGKTAARNDHAVKGVTPSPDNKTGFRIDGADDKTSVGIDGHRFVGIVERWVEQNHIPPQSMIRDDNGVADAVVESQILAELPGVLSETLIHVGAKDGVGAVTDFRVAVIESQSSVGDSDSRCT